MFCNQCGKQIPDGASFCTGCGAPVGSASVQPEQPVYQQPEQPQYQQPVYQQPEQPQYQQPNAYAQPQPRKVDFFEAIKLFFVTMLTSTAVHQEASFGLLISLFSS